MSSHHGIHQGDVVRTLTSFLRFVKKSLTTNMMASMYMFSILYCLLTRFSANNHSSMTGTIKIIFALVGLLNLCISVSAQFRRQFFHMILKMPFSPYFKTTCLYRASCNLRLTHLSPSSFCLYTESNKPTKHLLVRHD